MNVAPATRAARILTTRTRKLIECVDDAVAIRAHRCADAATGGHAATRFRHDETEASATRSRRAVNVRKIGPLKIASAAARP